MQISFNRKKWAFVAISVLLLFFAEMVDEFKFGVTYLILYLLIWFFVFFEDLKPILESVTKIKVAGIEAELKRKTELFEKEVVKVSEKEMLATPSTFSAIDPEIIEEVKAAKQIRDIEQEVEEVMHYSSQDPFAALLVLSQKIEFRLRLMLELYGYKGKLGSLSMAALIGQIEDKGVLLPDGIRTLRDFASIRNIVVHGESSTVLNKAVVMSFIDSGIKVLRMVDNYLP